MKKLHIALLSLFSLSTLPILATDPPITRKDRGEVRLSVGVGGATPWDASIRYDFGNAKYRLSPFFAINGTHRHNTATREDIDLTYTGIMPLSETANHQYLSSESLRTRGGAISYGADFQFKPSASDQIEAGLKLESDASNTVGSRTEQVFLNSGSEAQPGQRHLSQFVPSSYDGSDALYSLEATAGYTHTFQGSNWFMLGGKLDLRYSYLLSDDGHERRQTVLPGASYPGREDFDLQIWPTTQKHRLQLDILTPYITLLPIHIGAFYENRLMDSRDEQWSGQEKTLDDYFRHRYQTGGAYLKADWSAGRFKFNAKLEYDYTRMRALVEEQSKSRSLNDFVPELGVLWSMGKGHSLQASYVRRIIRPSLELLNPAEIHSTYTLSYGNPDLIGAHINNLSFRYQLKRDKVDFSTTLMHISANDGFNAIWMERGLARIYTWGNEGKRRAWSLTPDATWRPAKTTALHARLNVIWDKREAEAIHMAKEHWGFTTAADLTQTLPADILLKVNGEYSEGNTIDLYSHAGRQYSYGASLQRKLIPSGRLTGALSYSHFDAPKTIITQGAYVGSIYLRARHKDAGTLTLTYKF